MLEPDNLPRLKVLPVVELSRQSVKARSCLLWSRSKTLVKGPVGTEIKSQAEARATRTSRYFITILFRFTGTGSGRYIRRHLDNYVG